MSLTNMMAGDPRIDPVPGDQLRTPEGARISVLGTEINLFSSSRSTVALWAKPAIVINGLLVDRAVMPLLSWRELVAGWTVEYFGARPGLAALRAGLRLAGVPAPATQCGDAGVERAE